MRPHLLAFLVPLAAAVAIGCASEHGSPSHVPPPVDSEVWRASQELERRTGQVLSLVPKPDELSLVFSDDATSDDLNRLCASLPLDVIGPAQVPPWYHAFRVRGSVALEVIGPAAASWPRVEGGLPVYVGPDGVPRYIHPRDILVQFEQPETLACEQAIAAWGAVVSYDAWTVGMYEIRFSDGRTVFDHIRDLVHVDGLAYVEPVYWGFDSNLEAGHNNAAQKPAVARQGPCQ